MKMDFESAWTTSSEQVICGRCEELDLLKMLDEFPRWNSQGEQAEAVSQRSESIRCLGKTGTVEFRANCHVCHCLFAMTPNPSSNDQDVLLVPDWTLMRVTGEFGAVLDTIEKKQYATCLLVTLDPSSMPLPFAIHAHRGDSVCLMADDVKDGRTLGGRKLARSEVNIEIVKEWINRCATLHGSCCEPVLTEKLQQIRLVDVEERKIVKFPGGPCDYVAASYVWGGVPTKSFKLGDELVTLPRTLEDAVSFTKILGKRYMWADYLCIDQSNEAEKIDQIARMWSIYRGAHVTIFAMSGTSAEAGLSGFRRKEFYPQLTCCIKGRRLVGIMPTFSQQAWVTPWSRRAWTLQEAYLSPRCLYFTDHQMYFDCAAMLCCETLDHLRSWGHNLTPASNPTDREFLAWVTDQIGAGGYRLPLRDPEKRLETWGVKLNMYSYRDMTNDEDALRAFEGIEQQLRSMYPKGFFHGLPIEDFDWGLLWRSQGPSIRRECFPSWTWAGWKGGLWYGQPSDVTQTRGFPVHLEIHSFRSGQQYQIFNTEPIRFQTRTDGGSSIIDPAYQAAQYPSEGQVLDFEQLLAAENRGILMIDAVCLYFTLDFSRPRTHVQQHGQFELFGITIGGIGCFLHIISVDQEISRPKTGEDELFLLIARSSWGDHVSHHLLMVRPEPGNSKFAVRATTLELLVPRNGLRALRELKPRRRRIFLA